MKASKKEVENAILFFSEKFDQKEDYRALISLQSPLPKIVEMIVYEMFLRKFDYYNCSNEEYEQYMFIYEYVNELKRIGWVTFNK